MLIIIIRKKNWKNVNKNNLGENTGENYINMIKIRQKSIKNYITSIF